MAKITTDEVARIAHLARIALSVPEAKQLAAELDTILQYVSKLQSIDTKTAKTTSQVTGLKNVWRKDEIKPSLETKSALANAAAQQSGYIKVKKVL